MVRPAMTAPLLRTFPSLSNLGLSPLGPRGILCKAGQDRCVFLTVVSQLAELSVLLGKGSFGEVFKGYSTR